MRTSSLDVVETGHNSAEEPECAVMLYEKIVPFAAIMETTCSVVSPCFHSSRVDLYGMRSSTDSMLPLYPAPDSNAAEYRTCQCQLSHISPFQPEYVHTTNLAHRAMVNP